MKKRLLSLLLILCLCAALLPAAVFAEGNVIELNQTELDNLLGAATPIKDNNHQYLKYAKPLPAGNYRLESNIETVASIVIEGNVTLDLNGKSITRDLMYSCGAFRVIGKDASLTLTDSSQNETGKICDFFTETLGSGVYVDGGSFIMNGGMIDRCSGHRGGGGVYLTNGASFTMNAGTIRECTARENASGGGVYVDSGCTFIMEGGAIDSCISLLGSAAGVYAAGTFVMTGGEIRGCYTDDGNSGDGGGVYVAPSGAFKMSGGSIENCRAKGTYFDGKGGGVYVGGTFNMTGGTIKNCTAVGKGDGVYVADGAKAALVRGNIEGEIKGNWTEYIPPVDPIDPDYPLISILPALAKDLPFTDVTSTDWFYSDVKYAYETGLMTGTSGTAFSPEAPVTRGMVMTILARREGIRTDRYTPWYAAGCEWAKANGISDGSNPEAPVTREQLAAMLYRYAALKGRDLTAGENLNFTDASDVSAYALPALQWATGEKILTGSNGALNPQATATRAHLAAILHRYFG